MSNFNNQYVLYSNNLVYPTRAEYKKLRGKSGKGEDQTLKDTEYLAIIEKHMASGDPRHQMSTQSAVVQC